MTQTFRPSVADRVIHRFSRKPKLIVYGLTGIAIILAWGWVITMSAGVTSYFPAPTLGPGVSFLQPALDKLAAIISQSYWLSLFIKFCTPQTTTGVNIASAFGTFIMWCVMSFAMMLPSAAPMLRTYAEVSETAAEKNRSTVPTYILAIGYLSVWIGFAFLTTILQITFIQIGWAKDAILPINNILAGIILISAGLYQFSPLKDACLHKCRNPFTTLFGRWSDKPSRVYALGIEQGLNCLGCCWAIMMVMMVVGTMNLAWMAFLTLFTIVEKTGNGKVTSRAFAVILLLWGGILILLSV